MSDNREIKAARTTIVGGQPPGNERDVDDDTVPIGIESLLAMAAVDEHFAAALYKQRAEAIAASGVTLSPAERCILDAVEQPALKQMVANVGDAIPEPDRRAFFGRSAAALLAIASGGLGVGTGGCKDRGVPVTGSRPDIPEWDAAPVKNATPPDATPPPPDVAPDVEVPAKAKQPAEDKIIKHKTRGIRPDRPRSRQRERTLGIRPDHTLSAPSWDDED